MERYICLQPEYTGQFQCDGARCQSRCCRDWGVTLDDASIEKYRNIENRAEREEILSHVRRTEAGLTIELRENGWCAFLREDYLCRLQKKYGEEYLSCTCRTFPRMIYLLDGMLERSLSLACPVAAELILSGGSPMAFEQVEVQVDEPVVVRRPQPSEYQGSILEIQYTCISLLQDRRFSLDGRLALLGSFLEQVQGGGSVDALVGFYTSEELPRHAHGFFQAMEFHREPWAESMAELMEAVHAREREQSQEDLLLEHVGRRMGMEESTGIFRRGLRTFSEGEYSGRRAVLMEHAGAVLENFLVHEFFLNIYPFRVPGTLLQNFHVFLLGWKLLEFLLVAGEAEAEGRLREVLRDYAYRMDHTATYMACMKGMAMQREMGLASMLNSLLEAGRMQDG